MPSITLLPDGDSIPLPQHSSQADKYLTNTAMTDPIKVRDPVRVLLKRSCLSPKDTRHKPCQYKPAPVQTSVQQWATSLFNSFHISMPDPNRSIITIIAEHYGWGEGAGVMVQH